MSEPTISEQNAAPNNLGMTPERGRYQPLVRDGVVDISCAVLGALIALVIDADRAMTVLFTWAGFTTPILIKLHWRMMSRLASPEDVEQKNLQSSEHLRKTSEEVKQSAQMAVQALQIVTEESASHIQALIEAVICDWVQKMSKPPETFAVAGFKTVHENWSKWQDAVPTSENQESTKLIQAKAWAEFVGTHLQDVADRVAKRFVITDTNVFTRLYCDATKTLVSSFAARRSAKRKNRKIIRYHITAMLPEEFYNGPQIERLSTSSRPLFFCHRWENYEDFYKPDDHSEVVIRRCIIVRETGMGEEALGALSDLNDLKDQARLLINDKNELVKQGLILDANECPGVRARLLRHSEPLGHGSVDPSDSNRIHKQQELINQILGVEKYHYWPIVDRRDCRERGCLCKHASTWRSLFEVYSGAPFHKDPKDALYCTISATEWHNMSHSELITTCFKPGWTPEIVLFGEQEDKDQSPTWHFGIVGHYRPFTPRIELRFFNSTDTSQLFSQFTNTICKKNNGEPHALLNLCSGIQDGIR